ncbi:MAG: N-acetylglucosamine kinase [Candidatus Nanopelagicaceae bacterium]
MLKNVIFFDGGGSGIRAKSQSADGKSITKNFPGFSPGELPLVDYLANLIIEFAGEVGGAIDRAVLAVATLPADDKQYGDIADLVLAKSQVKEIWICSDSVSACAAAVEKDGVVIAAGTGITALAVGKNRSMVHSLAGDGFLVGDEASAYWIGKMALNSALRARDGRGGNQELLDVACKHFGAEPYQLTHTVHQLDRPVNAIAEFAKVVNDLAVSGNSAASEILNSAADEIVLIATTAKRECGGGPDFQVALIGGVLAPENLVTKLVGEKLKANGLRVHTSGKSSLDGAGALANLDEPGIFKPLIRTFAK